MFKTELETELEKTLKSIDMPLGERIYAEDLDINADLDDETSPVKSTDARSLIVLKMLTEEDFPVSQAQLNRGQQELFLRTSQVYNGLGFKYCVDANPPVGEKGFAAREIVDSVLRRRDFGKDSGENITIFYDPEITWKLRSADPRQVAEELYKLYNGGCVPASLTIGRNYGIRYLNFSAEAGEEHEMGLLRPVLEEMGREFQGKRLQGRRISELMEKLKELKDAVA